MDLKKADINFNKTGNDFISMLPEVVKVYKTAGCL